LPIKKAVSQIKWLLGIIGVRAGISKVRTLCDINLLSEHMKKPANILLVFIIVQIIASFVL
jgi:hypothetical protein